MKKEAFICVILAIILSGKFFWQWKIKYYVKWHVFFF